MLTEHEITLRVRYQETDGQKRLHHANYFNYFEMGRVELLRGLEDAGADGDLDLAAESCNGHRHTGARVEVVPLAVQEVVWPDADCDEQIAR